MKHQVVHALIACLYFGPVVGLDKALISAALAVAYIWLTSLG